MTETKFTPAQTKIINMLKRGVSIKRDMTGCNYFFLDDPACNHHRYRGFRTKLTTFNALFNAGLLMLKSNEYPWEIWVIKA